VRVPRNKKKFMTRKKDMQKIWFKQGVATLKMKLREESGRAGFIKKQNQKNELYKPNQ
jgi:hypothetical protein